tara:strand:+ start:822 stop:1220 length:399 start_codon:yes stop_codon:yes gene_type:complete
MYLVLSNINEQNISLNKNKNSKNYYLLYRLPYISLNSIILKLNINSYTLQNISNNTFTYNIYLNDSDYNTLLKIELYLQLYINNFYFIKHKDNKKYIILKSKTKINKNKLYICIKKIIYLNNKYIPVIYLYG